MESFADIAAAITEKGVTIHNGKGYSSYANAVRQIYSDAYTDEYEYPAKKQNPVMYALELIVWCKTIKEQIRQAIIDGGVECDETVPLSEYGNKIRQIASEQPLEIVTQRLPDGMYDTAYSAQLEATGGKEPYTWKFKRGILPKGLGINPDGTVTGTPTAAISISLLYVSCTDSAGNTVSKKTPIRIKPKEVHIGCRSSLNITYDGLPHTADIYCREYPDAELKITYGVDRTEYVVEPGMYIVNVTLLDTNLTRAPGSGDYFLIIEEAK